MLYQLSYSRSLSALVGARGFEPPTSSSQARRAAKLRYAPTGKLQYTENDLTRQWLVFRLEVLLQQLSHLLESHRPVTDPVLDLAPQLGEGLAVLTNHEHGVVAKPA
jgi:hypothetical protein